MYFSCRVRIAVMVSSRFGERDRLDGDKLTVKDVYKRFRTVAVDGFAKSTVTYSATGATIITAN